MKQMGEALRLTDEAAPMLKKLSDPGLAFRRDFLPSAMELKGVHLVRKGGRWEVEEIKFKELMWETCDKHKVFGLYYEKTIIFNGKAGMGKIEWPTRSLGCLPCVWRSSPTTGARSANTAS